MATILIVDDKEINRRLLATLLTQNGHTLLEAGDGEEVLEKVRTSRPDVIVADVLMPRMDGHEMLRQLKSDPLASNIPVVFFTAHYGARTLALAAGAAWFLTNAESAELNDVVERVLGGERQRAEAASPPDTIGRVEARNGPS